MPLSASGSITIDDNDNDNDNDSDSDKGGGTMRFCSREKQMQPFGSGDSINN